MSIIERQRGTPEWSPPSFSQPRHVLARLYPHPLGKRLSVHRNVDVVVTGSDEGRLLPPPETASASASIRIQQPEKRSGVQSSGTSETTPPTRSTTAATHPLTRSLHELTAIATPAETAASTAKRIERTPLGL